MAPSKKLLIHSLKQVVQVVNDDRAFLVGRDARKIAMLEASKDEGLSILVDAYGKIADIGPDSEVASRCDKNNIEAIIDGSNKCAIPGFVDAHTHAIWAGDRVHEFALKLAGTSYMEIHNSGGGIYYTVECVKKCSEDTLYESFVKRINMMMTTGTTTMECKSGYGLDILNEVKMLKVMYRATFDPAVAMEISATYCGAHAVPKGKLPEDATEDILNLQLPTLQRLTESKEVQVENIDVFCEQNLFNLEQTERILTAGKEMGLAINFHGEELCRMGSAEMGARLGARAISHLEEISDEGIQAMAQAGTVAVILPTTAYMLRLNPPPVRKMIDAGVIVALGSDFNPNAFCFAMPTVLHLACVLMKMSMDEALAAATINSAHSLGRSKTHGSLQVGKMADIVLVDACSWEHLIYQFGNHTNVISHVIKAGEVVHKKMEPCCSYNGI